MPRKVRGRPVAYGDAQLRALDTFLRGEYLMSLSGDPSALLEGEPFWEAGNAYFDVESFHIAVLDKTDFKVSARQTASALTQIGVRSVQRRFEEGVRRRIHTVPIPKGAWCMASSQEMADYWAKRPNFIGWLIGEGFIEFQREYDLHGASRAAIRFVRAEFEMYQDDKSARLLEALDSWDTKAVVSAFNDAIRIKPCEGGYSLQYSNPFVRDNGDIVDLLGPRFIWGEHVMHDAMLQITHDVVPLIEHTREEVHI